MSFTIALSNVLLTLLYILPGFIVGKMKKASADHLSTMSAILVYGCSPCMIASSFFKMSFSWEALGKMGLFFLVTLFAQVAFMAVVYLIFRKKKGDGRFRMISVGSVLGNVGFFGLPIVKVLLPDYPEATCYSAIFVVSMNILVFTVGVYCLTGNKKDMKLRASVVNPTTLSFLVVLPLYIFGVSAYLPDLFLGAVDVLGGMTTPLCMIILGIRLSVVPVKRLFNQPTVYLTVLLKLLLFPLFSYACVYFLPLDYAFKASVLILSAVPCASVILNMAEMYHAEREIAANDVLFSTLVCFLTIPLLTMLL